MLVGIISRPSSITIQIPHAPLSYGPWIVQNLGLCSLRQRVFILSLSNLVNMLVGIISRLSSITSQIPSGTPRFMALELSKNWISVSALQVKYPAPKNVVITIAFTKNTTGVFCVSLAVKSSNLRTIKLSNIWLYVNLNLS